MKNILGILLVAGSLAQSGCDKIASGDRLIAVETVASDHTILLTEFTESGGGSKEADGRI
ncbi:MAG: hypothetical protein RR837_06315 [Bacteroidales bacterium]